jgi:hypothetical protein
MNVITIRRRPRCGKKFKTQLSEVRGVSDRLRHRQESDYYAMAEAVLFGIIALVSAWPMLMAAQAIISYR